MLRLLAWCAVAAAGLALPARAADGKYTLQMAKTEPPKELKAPLQKLLTGPSIKLLDEKGESVGEFWFRNDLPSKATKEQVKNGLTYKELDETTLLGAVRFDKLVVDYRKQKVKAGVYTLRLAFQPQDGDHMGTAAHNEFVLLVAAEYDTKPDPMDAKDLRELSGKSLGGGNHPSVWMLFPNEKPPEQPQLVDKGMGHWALSLKRDVKAEAKGALGLALNLLGHSPAAE